MSTVTTLNNLFQSLLHSLNRITWHGNCLLFIASDAERPCSREPPATVTYRSLQQQHISFSIDFRNVVRRKFFFSYVETIFEMNRPGPNRPWHNLMAYYMSRVPKNIYWYSLQNYFSSIWAEAFFLNVLDPQEPETAIQNPMSVACLSCVCRMSNVKLMFQYAISISEIENRAFIGMSAPKCLWSPRLLPDCYPILDTTLFRW